MVSPPLFSVCLAGLVTSNNAYAKQNNLAYYQSLALADGKPVSPNSTNSFANAAKGVDWSSSFAQELTNQKGENAWPITSTTFILVHKATNKP